MSVARAWIVSALVTAVIVALVLGVGASAGQFGFGSEASVAPQDGAADGPFVERAVAAEDEEEEEGHERRERAGDEDEWEDDD